MRRNQLTPHDVAERRYTELIALPDLELCERSRFVADLPARRPACDYDRYIDGVGWQPCSDPGRWRWFNRAQGRTREGCTEHIAAAVRATHWLSRQRLRRGLTDG